MVVDARQVLEEHDAAKTRRAEQMPTEQDVLRVMMQCYSRLQELGWRDAVYCPKDGTPFHVIEFGSSGVHACRYEGEWPKGRWWIAEGGDHWPSRPVMYKKQGAGP